MRFLFENSITIICVAAISMLNVLVFWQDPTQISGSGFENIRIIVEIVGYLSLALCSLGVALAVIWNAFRKKSVSILMEDRDNWKALAESRAARLLERDSRNAFLEMENERLEEKILRQ